MTVHLYPLCLMRLRKGSIAKLCHTVPLPSKGNSHKDVQQHV